MSTKTARPDSNQDTPIEPVISNRPERHGAIKAVRRKQVYAGPCPKSDRHTNTTVYNTSGRTRHCKCNDCGHTWKVTGPYAEQWKEYCIALAEQFAQAERIDGPDGGKIVVMTDQVATELAKSLTQLVNAG